MNYSILFIYFWQIEETKIHFFTAGKNDRNLKQPKEYKIKICYVKVIEKHL